MVMSAGSIPLGVNIVLTRFENIHDGRKALGVRMFDDHGHATYDYDLFTEEDLTTELTELEILREIVANPVNEAVETMLDEVRSGRSVVCINGKVFGYHDTKEILEDEDEDEDQVAPCDALKRLREICVDCV